MIVKMDNALHSVDAGPGVALKEGETSIGTSSFSDPGADTWTVTVDIVDVSLPEVLALSEDPMFRPQPHVRRRWDVHLIANWMSFTEKVAPSEKKAYKAEA